MSHRGVIVNIMPGVSGRRIMTTDGQARNTRNPYPMQSLAFMIEDAVSRRPSDLWRTVPLSSHLIVEGLSRREVGTKSTTIDLTEPYTRLLSNLSNLKHPTPEQESEHCSKHSKTYKGNDSKNA